MRTIGFRLRAAFSAYRLQPIAFSLRHHCTTTKPLAASTASVKAPTVRFVAPEITAPLLSKIIVVDTDTFASFGGAPLSNSPSTFRTGVVHEPLVASQRLPDAACCMAL